MTEKTTTKKSSKSAAIRTGGKQYLVAEGDIVKIEKLSEKDIKDGKVTFDDVLMIIDGDSVDLGKPTVSKKVSAEVVEEGRDKKISVVHYKSKSRYFKRNGHRQPFTKVKITKIA
jgi:large subunit ribosomal protein L21